MAVTFDDWLNPVTTGGLPANTTLPGNTPLPNTIQQSAIKGNIAAVPQIDQLTALINEINRNAQQAANAARVPGGAALEQTSSGNISNALAGQLDPSVIRQIGQRAAERGVSTGSPMAANSNADYLRSIGLNSLDLMNTGQNWLSQATGRNPAAPIFNPSSMFLTPEQAGQLDLERLRLQAEIANRNFAHRGGSSDVGFGGRNTAKPVVGPVTHPNLISMTGDRGGQVTYPNYPTYEDQLNADINAIDWTGYNPFGTQDEQTEQPAYDYNWEDFAGYA